MYTDLNLLEISSLYLRFNFLTLLELQAKSQVEYLFEKIFGSRLDSHLYEKYQSTKNFYLYVDIKIILLIFPQLFGLVVAVLIHLRS